MPYDGKIKIDTLINTKGVKKGLGEIEKGVAATGAAIAGGLAAATKVGMDFEQTLAKASTLFGDVKVDVDGLKSKMLDLSSATGIAATELDEGLYSALSAGIPVTEDMADATEFLGSSAKLAKAGFTDVDTAISATAKTLNAYKMDTSQAERIQGILIQTQNKGITTVNELGASLAQVTPTAAAFNVSFENVGAALATMTAQGTPTAQATTQLNSLIAELGKTGTIASDNLLKAARGTKYAGMSFTDMMSSGASLDDVLQLLGKSAQKNGLSMVDMFSSIEAGKSALSIVSGEGMIFNSNLEAMSDTAGLVDDAYKKMMDTLSGQLSILGESTKNLGSAVYDGIQEPMKEAVESSIDEIGNLTKSVSDGELKGAVEGLGNSFSRIISFATKLITNVLPFVTKHFLTLAQAILSSVAAVKSFYIVETVTKKLLSVRAALIAYTAAVNANAAASNGSATCSVLLASTLKPLELIIGVLTGAVTRETATEVAWNAVRAVSTAGISLLVGAIGAAVAGLVTWCATGSLASDKAKTLKERLDELNESYKNTIESIDDSAKSEVAEAEKVEVLKDKLFELDDQIKKTTESQGDATEAKKNFNTTASEMCKIIPDLKDCIYDENGAINLQRDAVNNLTGAYLSLIIAKSTANAYEKKMNASADKIAALKEERNNLPLENGDPGTFVIDASSPHRDRELKVVTAIGPSYPSSERLDLNRQISEEEERRQTFAEEYIKTTQDAADLVKKFTADPSEPDTSSATSKSGGGKSSSSGKSKSSGSSSAADEAKKRVIRSAITKSYYEISDKFSSELLTREDYYKQIAALRKRYFADGSDEYNDFTDDAVSHFEKALYEQLQNGQVEYEGYYNGLETLQNVFLNTSSEDYDKYSEEIMKTAVSVLDERKKRGEISEAEYYQDISRLRDKYLREGSQAYSEYTNSVIEYNNKCMTETLKNAETVSKDIQEEFKNRINSLKQMQQQFMDKLKGTTSLFYEKTTKFIGFGKNGEDEIFTDTHLANLTEQTSKLKEYSAALQNIKKRGAVPNEFFDQVREMSVEDGKKFADTLLNASDDEFNDYIKSWQEQQNAITVISGKAYSSEFEKMKTELESQFGQLPDEFFNIGQDSMDKFGEGFSSKLSEIMTNARKLIASSMRDLIPSYTTATGSNNPNTRNVYQDNRQTTIYATEKTGHDVVQTAKDNAVYQNHTTFNK